MCSEDIDWKAIEKFALAQFMTEGPSFEPFPEEWIGDNNRMCTTTCTTVEGWKIHCWRCMRLFDERHKANKGGKQVIICSSVQNGDIPLFERDLLRKKLRQMNSARKWGKHKHK